MPYYDGLSFILHMLNPADSLISGSIVSSGDRTKRVCSCLTLATEFTDIPLGSVAALYPFSNALSILEY